MTVDRSWTDRLDRLHERLTGPVDRGELPGLVTVVSRGDDVRVTTMDVVADFSSLPG